MGTNSSSPMEQRMPTPTIVVETLTQTHIPESVQAVIYTREQLQNIRNQQKEDNY